MKRKANASPRKLQLKKEKLRELTLDQLSRIKGGDTTREYVLCEAGTA